MSDFTEESRKLQDEIGRRAAQLIRDTLRARLTDDVLQQARHAWDTTMGIAARDEAMRTVLLDALCPPTLKVDDRWNCRFKIGVVHTDGPCRCSPGRCSCGQHIDHIGACAGIPLPAEPTPDSSEPAATAMRCGDCGYTGPTWICRKCGVAVKHVAPPTPQPPSPSDTWHRRWLLLTERAEQLALSSDGSTRELVAGILNEMAGVESVVASTDAIPADAPQPIHNSCHEVWCNGSRHEPRGAKGYSCSCRPRGSIADKAAQESRHCGAPAQPTPFRDYSATGGYAPVPVEPTPTDAPPAETLQPDTTSDSYILHHAGIVEVAVRNSSVAEYMRHWEKRTEQAEAERDEWRRRNDEKHLAYVSLVAERDALKAELSQLKKRTPTVDR